MKSHFGSFCFKINKYDLMILDLTLPGMDGLDVCKKYS